MKSSLPSFDGQPSLCKKLNQFSLTQISHNSTSKYVVRFVLALILMACGIQFAQADTGNIPARKSYMGTVIEGQCDRSYNTNFSFPTLLEAAQFSAAHTASGVPSVNPCVIQHYDFEHADLIDPPVRYELFGKSQAIDQSDNVYFNVVDIKFTCDAGTSPGAGGECTWSCPVGQSYVNGLCQNTKNKGKPDCSKCVGDPINAGTGNHYEEETIFQGVGSFPLRFSWYYNSDGLPQAAVGANKIWRHYYDRRLWVGVTSDNQYLYSVERPDGRVVQFISYGGSFRPRDADVADQLIALSPSGWQYIQASDETVETYTANGNQTAGTLTSIRNRDGMTQTLSYIPATAEFHPLVPDLLTAVTDDYGHQLKFNYDTANRLIQITDPSNAVYQFVIDDTSGNLSTITFPDTKVRTYLYNEAAFTSNTNQPYALTGILDENGNRYATWNYDSQGRAISSEHAGGVDKYSVSYSASQSSVTDPLNTARNYNFVSVQNVVKSSATSKCQSGCTSSVSRSYDANGNLTSFTDYNGNTTTYVYDLTRNLELSRTEASGTPQARTITTAYLSNYRLPSQIDEPGRRTTVSYDNSGNLLTKTIKDTATNTTRTWTYTYNNVGQVLTADGPRTDLNDVTTFAYNTCTTGGGCGQVHAVTDALNHVTTINSYDANGRPLSITDPNGVQTTLSYNARGWLTSRQTSTETTTYQYDGVGQLTKITLPVGAFLSYTYDGAHRLTQITDQLGNKIVYTLDGLGNRTQENVYDPSNLLTQTRQHVYDSLSRLQKDLGAQNQTTTYAYDTNDNLTQITDPLNHVTQNSYDALNRLVQVTDPGNGIAKYNYNALDQLTQVTDPRNLLTKYTPNALGDNAKTTSPDSGDTISTFDNAGNVLTRKDARSQTTSYQYDALNRLTKTTRNDGTVITFTYDQGANGINRLTTMTDPSGSTAWVYDALGRVTKKTQTNGSTSLVTQYAYDSAGRISSQTLPSSKVITYTWTNGQITALSLNNAPLVSNLVYQPFGAPKSWSFGNGQAIARSFDQDGRLSSYDLGSLSYDAASRITNLTLGGNSILTGSKTYGYDTLDRLTSYASGAGSIGYVYDANGNLTTASASGNTPTTFTISPTSNKIASIVNGSTSFTPAYDANGSLTQDPKNSYSYDSANQLIAPSGYSYTYNGLRQRVQKSVSTVITTLSNPTLAPVTGLIGSLLPTVIPTVQQTTSTVGTPTVTTYVYDEAGHLIGEYNGTTPIQETIWLGDQPMATTQPGGTFYIHSDQLNTPRQIDNAQGQAVWAWDSITYGATAANEDPRNTGTKFSYSLRFPGQYFDTETGLSNNWMRNANPVLGRNNESDPLGFASGNLNPYGYANQNPISFSDPTGLAGGIGPVQAGQAGVNYVLKQYQNPNVTIKQEITLEVPGVGRVRLDIGAYDQQSRQLEVNEVKNGPNARLTEGQRACFNDVAKGNFIPRGANAKNLGLNVGVKGGGASAVELKITNLNGAKVTMPGVPVGPIDGIPVELPPVIDIPIIE